MKGFPSFDYKKIFPILLTFLILGLGLFFFFGEYSRIGVAFLFEVFVLFVVWIVDRFVFPDFDLVAEIIERQNVALVLFLLGLMAISLLAS